MRMSKTRVYLVVQIGCGSVSRGISHPSFSRQTLRCIMQWPAGKQRAASACAARAAHLLEGQGDCIPAACGHAGERSRKVEPLQPARSITSAVFNTLRSLGELDCVYCQGSNLLHVFPKYSRQQGVIQRSEGQAAVLWQSAHVVPQHRAAHIDWYRYMSSDGETPPMTVESL